MMNALKTCYISSTQRAHAFYNIMNLTDFKLQFNICTIHYTRIAAKAMIYN